ncbi:MAG: T9SS type A sorting domain-containing protein [Bacteroidetes bacterium]|nr:T9SS type A sorting domain-containing protein [Bacteroidota bacterium]
MANPQNYALRLTITDLTGRTLLETHSAATTIRLSLANLASGIYLYQIKTNNGTTTQGNI